MTLVAHFFGARTLTRNTNSSEPILFRNFILFETRPGRLREDEFRANAL
jgi:hypothetical protein